MANERARILISGRVQGVWFRVYTRKAADAIGVTGWVRNLPDRRVEALVEGEEEKVEAMINWCHQGSPSSRVDSVDVAKEDYTGEFDSFSITY